MKKINVHLSGSQFLGLSVDESGMREIKTGRGSEGRDSAKSGDDKIALILQTDSNIGYLIQANGPDPIAEQ